ncbi:MAG: ABC transporter ATP-binding protein [Lautropia sp.]
MTSASDAAGPPVSKPPVLELRGVARRFDASRWVLRDVSLAVAAGERVVLVGESGVGKSTLLNLAAGLDRPDQGSVLLDGQPLAPLDEPALAALRRARLGFVFQAFHLIPHLTAWQNVALPLLLNGVAERDAGSRARAVLAELGLAGRSDDHPATLSGGEQQRVALARALVHLPALILADEPTGNLDPGTAAAAIALLDAQVRSRGAALLLVTHSAQAERIADRLLRLTPEGIAAV